MCRMSTKLRLGKPNQLFVPSCLQDRRALEQVTGDENDLDHDTDRRTFYARSGRQQWPTQDCLGDDQREAEAAKGAQNEVE